MPGMDPKPQDAQPICTQCSQFSATHHICEINCGEKQALDLCDKCAAEYYQRSGHPFLDFKDAKCYYCGGQATHGSMNQQWEREVREVEYHFTCATCFETYSRLLLAKLNRIASGISSEDSMERTMNRMSQAVRDTDDKVRAIAKVSKN